MTYFGLCPSFNAWTSRLPLFADPFLRGRAFELIDADGALTGEPVVLGHDGWPVAAPRDRWNSVRVFGDMGGRAPDVLTPATVRRSPSNDAMTLAWAEGGPQDASIDPGQPLFHRQSIALLQSFRPTVLRTLDWSRANAVPRWAAPGRPLQGDDGGVDLRTQILAAHRVGARLWWNAPPRYGMGVEAYKAALQALAWHLPSDAIVEYGNELWNTAFPVALWLRSLAADRGVPWQRVAAEEIALARSVLPQGVSLFVGGQLTVPFNLNGVLAELAALGVVPAFAGPALYATPLKADADRWAESGAVPSQDELQHSVLARLPALADLLAQHGGTVTNYGTVLAVYEAGQSLIAKGRPWRAAALAAQREPWMGDVYRSLRAMLAPAAVANWYSACTSQEPADPLQDVFGLSEGVGRPDLPKAVAAKGL